MSRLAKGTKNVGQLLRKWEEEKSWADTYALQEMSQKKEGVHLYTLHGTKGLEFDEVFIIDCNEENIPSGKADTPEKIQEERRLFYVGITRAKKIVYLYYLKETLDKKNRPSRFLLEMQEARMDSYSMTSSESSSSINSSKRFATFSYSSSD